MPQTRTYSLVTSTVTGSSITVASVIDHRHTLCRGDEVLVQYDYIPFTLQFQQQKDFIVHTQSHPPRCKHSNHYFMHHPDILKDYMSVDLSLPKCSNSYSAATTSEAHTHSECPIISWLLEGVKMKTPLTLGRTNPPTSTDKFISPHQTQMENGF